MSLMPSFEPKPIILALRKTLLNVLALRKTFINVMTLRKTLLNVLALRKTLINVMTLRKTLLSDGFGLDFRTNAGAESYRQEASLEEKAGSNTCRIFSGLRRARTVSMALYTDKIYTGIR